MTTNNDYKIYEGIIKVYKDGRVDTVDESERDKIKPRVSVVYVGNLGIYQAKLTFNCPKSNYLTKSRVFAKILAELFIDDLPKGRWYTYEIDGDCYNISLDNVGIKKHSDLISNYYDKADVFVCECCNKEMKLVVNTIVTVVNGKKYCNKCHIAYQKNKEQVEKRSSKSFKEFSHIDLDRTILNEKLKKQVKLRKEGKTLQEIGDMYGVSRESIRLNMNKARKYGGLNRDICRSCNSEIFSTHYDNYELYLKNKLCKDCYNELH